MKTETKQPAKERAGKRKKAILTRLCIYGALLIFLIIACDARLKVVTYDVDSDKIDTPIKIILITDLHSCYYGKNSKTLLKAIDREKPDLICLGGDFFDDYKEDTSAIAVLAGIRDKYPCYYVTGNHEYWSGRAEEMHEILTSYGVTILDGVSDTIVIKGQTLNICGVSDPDVSAYSSEAESFSTQLRRVAKITENGNFTILVSHRPEFIRDYTSFGFDLTLCGHAHGGQWRLPGIVNGLYVPNQGLFPKYAGGEYYMNGEEMIVSRGLARETTRLPRVFNRPELVVINVK